MKYSRSNIKQVGDAIEKSIEEYEFDDVDDFLKWIADDSGEVDNELEFEIGED